MQVISNEKRIQILSDIIAIKSVNGNEIEVANYLKDLFAEHGIEAKVVELPEEGRANLVAEIGEGKPVLGMSGHMDVVDAGDESKWSYPPYELTEADGKLYGRGSTDMKSGLAAYTIALIEIKENDLLEKGTLRFMATSGEELGQIGSSTYFNDGYMEDVDALMIGEPASTLLNYANKGSMNAKITSKGKSAHSSMPFAGVNAIEPLVEFIEDIQVAIEDEAEKVNPTAFDFSGWLKDSFGDAEYDIDSLSEYLNNTLLTNTVINGGNQINSVPESAYAYFNVRTVPEFNNERVKEIFDDILKKHNDEGSDLTVEWELDLESAMTDGKNSLVTIHQEVAKKHFDIDVPAYPTTGVTDASNLIKGKPASFPFVVFGPGVTKLAHQTDEYVEKDQYLAFPEFYKEVIVRYTNEYEG